MLHILTHLILTKIPWGIAPIFISILQMRKIKLVQIAFPQKRKWKIWEIRDSDFFLKTFHGIEQIICLSAIWSVENYDVFCKNHIYEIWILLPTARSKYVLFLHLLKLCSIRDHSSSSVTWCGTSKKVLKSPWKLPCGKVIGTRKI